jgi:hypothetical protein
MLEVLQRGIIECDSVGYFQHALVNDAKFGWFSSCQSSDECYFRDAAVVKLGRSARLGSCCGDTSEYTN